MTASESNRNLTVLSMRRAGQNRVLSLLPMDERERLLARCTRMSSERGEVLYAENGDITHVYFVLSGIVSLVRSEKETSGSIEVGMIGNEGLAGTPISLGTGKSPTKTLWQAAGDALRMSAREFAEELHASATLRRAVGRYTQALQNHMAQSLVCNAYHTVEQRLCRWLLMSQDRLAAEELPLTQEFIAQMLGTRRPSVTMAAGALQTAGLIRYRRGHIRIQDRPGLEAGSCECYAVLRAEYEWLMAEK